MFGCEKCGWENPGNAVFCTNCGSGLAKKNSEQASTSSSEGWRFGGQIEGSPDLKPLSESQDVGSQTEVAADNSASLQIPRDDDPKAGSLAKHEELTATGGERRVGIRNARTLIDLSVPDFREMVGRPDAGGVESALDGRGAADGMATPIDSETPLEVEDFNPDTPVAAKTDDGASVDSEPDASPESGNVSSAHDSSHESIATADEAPDEFEDMLDGLPQGAGEAGAEDAAPNGDLNVDTTSAEADITAVGEVSEGGDVIAFDAATDIDGGVADEDGQSSIDDSLGNTPEPAHLYPSSISGGPLRDLGSLDIAIESIDSTLDADDLVSHRESLAESKEAILSSVDMTPVSFDDKKVRGGNIALQGTDDAMAAPPPIPKEGALALRSLSAPNSSSVNLTTEPVVIGRSGDVALLKDEFLSPQHAQITLDGDGVWVEDLDSLNGVWIRSTGTLKMKVGEQFLLGKQVLRVEAASREGHASLMDNDGTRRTGSTRSLSAFRLAQLGTDNSVIARFDVPRDGCKIGRRIADFVFTDDESVSLTHAWVIPTQEQTLEIRDISNGNGCWRQARGRSKLVMGDAVMLGRSVWRLTRLSVG
jgi:hypothetical protein